MIDTAQLENIQNLTFNQFRTEYQNGNSVAGAYYIELANQGAVASISNIENYGLLARDVATNNGFRGIYANQFSSNVALFNGVDFTVGNNEWLQMQYRLMQEDFTVRKNNIEGGGTGELNFLQTNDIHELAFEQIDVPAEAYSLYTPLSQIGEYDTIRAQSIFNNTLTDPEGFWGFLRTAGRIGFNANISTGQSNAEIAQDYLDQAFWFTERQRKKNKSRTFYCKQLKIIIRISNTYSIHQIIHRFCG